MVRTYIVALPCSSRLLRLLLIHVGLYLRWRHLLATHKVGAIRVLVGFWYLWLLILLLLGMLSADILRGMSKFSSSQTTNTSSSIVLESWRWILLLLLIIILLLVPFPWRASLNFTSVSRYCYAISVIVTVILIIVLHLIRINKDNKVFTLSWLEGICVGLLYTLFCT